VGASDAAVMMDGRSATIRLRDTLTAQHAPEIRDAFRTLIARGHECITVDAAKAAEVESPCALALVEAAQAAHERGVQVKWAGLTPRLRELLSAGVAETRGQRAPSGRRGGRGDLALDLPCIPESVALIRSNITRLLAESAFTATEVDDIILAVGEAAANAVRHGLRFGDECLLRMRCHAGPSGLSFEITDPGDGFDPERVRVPDAGGYHEGGLGIYVMRRVMDEVTYTFDARGTTVRLVKRLGRPRITPKGVRPLRMPQGAVGVA